ncbi:hypothetical protein HS1genome_0856 [Sulfodiicoccus acidiphilus]|uniref:CobQ/CobB/MinD/ParA nucleotide binding domain-containing protein n=1 Tax=Sulfodiicoccus acidiphilus TaxID=1670455 RepID=A0A348B2R5_9CREN|nr:P-loop NTPase [Sulfodiicoccus acidiphilus]BBD72467.1 hypothetical protein HS1genome_0856 [Sulfodiicoccus acidiphilus]GGT96920.1 hypothetical protein GCM10007116_13020 [Sulfodiicoccus acidiphilus]
MFLLVLGAKGGVGKSTVAATLALQLAKQGREVLLLDMDPLNWSSYVLERLIGNGRSLEGRVNSIKVRGEGPAVELIKLRNQEVCVLDPPPITRWKVKTEPLFGGEVAKRVYVTDSSISSVKSTIALASFLRGHTHAVNAGLVVNMVPPVPEELANSSKFRRLCEELEVSVCGVVPFDERLYSYSAEGPLDVPIQLMEIAYLLVSERSSGFVD